MYIQADDPPLQIQAERAHAFYRGRITVTLAALFIVGASLLPTKGDEVEIAPRKMATLTPQQQKRVAEAIDRGLTYLRRTQLGNGSWTLGRQILGKKPPDPDSSIKANQCPLGMAALCGLTLLECGVEAGDPAVKQAARLVRLIAPGSFRTYEISLAILFLDRLGEAGDRPLIRSLSLRLVAGQGAHGGWRYGCPILTQAQEKKILEQVRNAKPEDLPRLSAAPIVKGKRPETRDNADNSNTQFAILALWVARRHDLPLDWTLARIDQRFRASQQPGGWAYRFYHPRCYGSMTCVGLLALAVGRGSGTNELGGGKQKGEKPEDRGITAGLLALGGYLRDPTDSAWGGLGASSGLGPKGALSLYFLWSVERVGVLCNLKTIGGKDWYPWGVDLLLPAQRLDGSWLGRGSGGFPVVDTCFALLFLKRSDLLPDLRESLQKRLKITDPYFDKAISPKKSPGEKTVPKTKSPGEEKELKKPIDNKGFSEKTGLSMPEPFSFTQPPYRSGQGDTKQIRAMACCSPRTPRCGRRNENCFAGSKCAAMFGG